MPSEINATIQQQGKLGHLRELQIKNGKEVVIGQQTGSRKQVYQIHLLALADKSRPRLHIAWPWLWSLLISLTLLGIYAIVRQFVNGIPSIVDFAIVLLCALGIILGGGMTVLKITRKRVYFSRHAQIPLFDILINKPDRGTYRQFTGLLDSYMQKAREFFDLKVDQQIAGEIRMLRRLASEGVISQSDYDRAKNKLFSLSNTTAK